MVIVRTNYVKLPYMMTYLEPLQVSEREPCKNNKTTKAPSKTCTAVLNTRMLRELVKKFRLHRLLQNVQSWL